jgi:hypothetical protein
VKSPCIVHVLEFQCTLTSALSMMNENYAQQFALNRLRTHRPETAQTNRNIYMDDARALHETAAQWLINGVQFIELVAKRT